MGKQNQRQVTDQTTFKLMEVSVRWGGPMLLAVVAAVGTSVWENVSTSAGLVATVNGHSVTLQKLEDGQGLALQQLRAELQETANQLRREMLDAQREGRRELDGRETELRGVILQNKAEQAERDSRQDDRERALRDQVLGIISRQPAAPF